MAKPNRNKSKAMRLDDALIEKGFSDSREHALRQIIAGCVLVDDVVATSGVATVTENNSIRLKGVKRFVSRGGDKLLSAMEAFNLSVEGLRCIDIGSSTGGFTDCLLQAKAREVVCVDVNYGQLAWKIRNNPRVKVFERTNIRLADPLKIGSPFDVIVIDVSFIGLSSLVPILANYAEGGTLLVALVKPQFESAHDETVGGVVVDEKIRARTLDEVCEALSENGFCVIDTMESPVIGPAGNHEYLVYAKYEA